MNESAVHISTLESRLPTSSSHIISIIDKEFLILSDVLGGPDANDLSKPASLSHSVMMGFSHLSDDNTNLG